MLAGWQGRTIPVLPKLGRTANRTTGRCAMKRTFVIVSYILTVIGMLVLVGSFFGFLIGPERLAELYQRFKPVVPYFLTGLGLVVVGSFGSSLLDQPSEKRPAPSDEQIRTDLAKNLASLEGATAEDIEKTLAVIMAADRNQLGAAESLLRQLAA